jgi:hypothetical protein
MRFRLVATPDEKGWSFQLVQERKFGLGQKHPIPLAQRPDAAASLAGAAWLLALLDRGEATTEAEAILLGHEQVARLSRCETDRIGLPPTAPFTLFLSHDAPIGDPRFTLRVEWFQRDGAPVFAPRRSGSSLAVGARTYLILDPIYSALEAIDAVNAASGDPSPAGLDRRMTAYARFKERLVWLTGGIRADGYLRGLTIHQATGLGIDLEPGGDEAAFQPTLYGDRPVDTVAVENEDLAPIREPLLPHHYAQQFQQRFGCRPGTELMLLKFFRAQGGSGDNLSRG